MLLQGIMEGDVHDQQCPKACHGLLIVSCLR